jgi:chloramphenicol O-acetyltransferase type A
MRKIDLKTWPRSRHFELFRDFEYPHFGLCANLDITSFYNTVKNQGLPFSVAIAHLLAATANSIPEFRQRIRLQDQDLQVIEHDIVHPSFTVLGESDLFSFCTVPFHKELPVFAAKAAERIQAVRANPVLKDEPGQDDLLFMTSIPWVSFTSLMHPIRLEPTDSIPRLAWGKFFQDGERMKIPLSLQAHHGLMDGVHAGRFYQLIEEKLR